MQLPAVCDRCGTIFPSGLFITNSQISIYKCTTGPCPKCGGNGHIPDGVYKVINSTIELLSGPSRTVSELKRLSVILNQARERKTSLKELSDILQEEIPNLSTLSDFLPKTRSDFYQILNIILMIISILINLVNQSQVSKVEVNQVINMIYQQQLPSISDIPKSSTEVKKNTRIQKKIGRNQPCPCGSGKKYKKCCINKK